MAITRQRKYNYCRIAEELGSIDDKLEWHN